MSRAVDFRRDEAFDPHEVGAYDIRVITRDGNARTLSLTIDEALSLYGDMQLEFEG